MRTLPVDWLTTTATALVALLMAEADDGAEGVQRHVRLEAAEVARGELLEVLAEVDDAEGVDRLGGVGGDLDAVVEHDDVGAVAELLAADGLEQDQAEALLGGDL